MKHLTFLALLLVLVAALMPAAAASTTSYYFFFNTYSQETYGVTAYSLSSTQNASDSTTWLSSNQTGVLNVTYGFRVYLLNPNGQKTAVSNGVIAQYVLSSPVTNFIDTTWTCPETRIVLGYQALNVELWELYQGGSWVEKAEFISPILLTSQIEETTWTFHFYVTYTRADPTVFTVGFGSDSGVAISGVTLQDPTNSELSLFKQGQGDIVGFILGAYINQIGVGFYLLVLLMLTGALWLNYKHIGPVLFVFVIFGGSGGLIWVFVPPVGAAVIDVLLLLGFAALLYKVSRN